MVRCMWLRSCQEPYLLLVSLKCSKEGHHAQQGEKQTKVICTAWPYCHFPAHWKGIAVDGLQRTFLPFLFLVNLPVWIRITWKETKEWGTFLTVYVSHTDTALNNGRVDTQECKPYLHSAWDLSEGKTHCTSSLHFTPASPPSLLQPALSQF